ncbi:amidohydrolase family protein [Sphingobium aromaticiconvertens]|uniref:amidohydrolase family protein n=1 Tax=Sphingobium aromaticiconvertens TaxID=365341 RepID=UPI003017FCE3
MLIRDAEIRGHGRADVRIAKDVITAIGTLSTLAGEVVHDAHGGALLPGLHDHHIHLAALAVARSSVACGPPGANDATELAQALTRPGEGWLRGIGYHDSVAGMLDAEMLDTMAPHRPVRIQHRSGRMWFFNSAGLDLLLAAAPPPPGLEQQDGRWTGRLFDEDRWLRETLGGTPPSFAAISRELAAMGITGLTDMSPANDVDMARHFAREQASGALSQRVMLAGTLGLAKAPFGPTLTLGPAKLHLHENALPAFDDSVDFMRAAHEQQRGVAIHCTTETELVFALAALDAAGPLAGDRIEHAGVVPDPLIAEMLRLKVQVVTQPHFIAERGDQYLKDVEPRDPPFLYRLDALRRAGLVVAAGSDAPFGSCDPWAAMRAAVVRQTASGTIIGPDETSTPEQALALYLADPQDLMVERRIAVGARADLCLLNRPWAQARDRLLAHDVQLTLIGGSIVHDGVDQAPA